MKDLYNENCKTLKKSSRNEKKKRNHIPYSWTGRISLIKMATLLNAVSIKISILFFTELEKDHKIHMEFIWNHSQSDPEQQQ